MEYERLLHQGSENDLVFLAKRLLFAQRGMNPQKRYWGSSFRPSTQRAEAINPRPPFKRWSRKYGKAICQRTMPSDDNPSRDIRHNHNAGKTTPTPHHSPHPSVNHTHAGETNTANFYIPHKAYGSFRPYLDEMATSRSRRVARKIKRLHSDVLVWRLEAAAGHSVPEQRTGKGEGVAQRGGIPPRSPAGGIMGLWGSGRRSMPLAWAETKLSSEQKEQAHMER
ncbi:hypothetical protein SKAU_G00170410 [Synaphobranchus kaupii]|uniref:Uncharacterized protein n=1 Tax=Synaphobranchus kaupii TaxID=118154 RepID=A0A9Q1FKG3_SYNKA|nr:hypothetical protein SKAU_G00170410 [Synaphobranchus kaupii]